MSSLILALVSFGAALHAYAATVPTTTTLAISPASPQNAGTVETLTAHVTNPSVAVTQGTVYFFDITSAFVTNGSSSNLPQPHLLGTAQLLSNGTASLTQVLPAATHVLHAVFMSTPAAAKSASSPHTFVVTGGSGTVTLSATETGTRGAYGVNTTMRYNGITPPAGTLQVIDTSNSNNVVASTTHLADQGANHTTFAYGLGSAPTVANPSNNVAMADWTRSGNLGLAIPNGTNLALFLGNGDGTFGAESDFPISGGAAKFIDSGDLNGDGYTDVVVSDTSNNLVSVLLNDQAGGMLAAVTYNVASPGRVVVGNFITGNLDIAVVTAAGVSILPNNGNGTFGTAMTLTASSPTDMVAADLNGDGYLDLAVSSQTGNSFTVFLNNGDGTMAAGVATILAGSRSPFGITSGDYNGDGIADLATVDPQGYLITLVNDGTGTHFQQNLVASVGTGTNSGPTDYSKYLATLDLNGDGWADLVVGESLTNILYTATGDSYFTSGTNTYFLATGPVTTPNTNGVVTAGDLNNDGLSDFVLAGGQPSLWLSYATTAVTYPVGGFGQSTYNVTSTTSFAPHTLRVDYVPASGSGFSAASSGTFTASVMGSSTPVVTTNASSINYGGNVVVTITLPPVGGVTPTGNIILNDGAYNATPLTLSGGTAAYTSTQPGGGIHPFFAEYVGDTNFVPRTSATVPVTVVPETPASISITASPTNQIVNGPVTLTGTIVAPASGSGGQTLNFDIAGFPGGSCVTNNAGTCSVTMTMPGLGTQNANVNNTATVNTVSVSHATTVNGFQQTMVPVITSSVNPTFTGQTTTFTITLPVTGGVLPNGTITLTRNGTTIATLTAYQTGTVTYTTNGTPIGTNSMVASYSLDLTGSYLPGSSAIYTQNVGNASTVVTLAVSPANATQGTLQTLTLSAVSGGSLAVSNGVVQFFDTTARPQLLGTAQINTTNATATLTRAFSPGPHSFYAVLTMPSPGLTGHTSSTVSSTVTPVRTYPFSLSLSRAGAPGAYSLTATAAHTSSFPPTPLAFLDHTNGDNPIASSPWTAPVRSIAPTGLTPNAAGQGSYSTAVGDVNGDGIPDMVVSNYGDVTIGVFIGNGDGTFQPEVTYAANQAYTQILLLDMNADGILDMVGLNDGNNAVDVSLGLGNGTFSAPLGSAFFEQYTGGYSTQVAFGDINKDGYLDVISANSFLGISLLAGDGTGNMPNHVDFNDPNYNPIRPLTLAVGDFNNDGNLDVVTANLYNVANATNGCPSAPAPCVGSVTVWMGDGNGNLTPQSTYYDVGQSPYGITVGDFNGDGNLDVAVANQNDQTIGVLLGNGDGTLQAMVTYPAGTVGPQMVKAVDVDGDGILDLVAVDTNTQITTGNGAFGGNQYNSTSANAFLILKGNGDGTFQTAVSITTPSSSTPYDISFGDFDGDGLMDLAVPYTFGYNNDNVSTWPNSKTGVFMGRATATSTLTGSSLNAAGPVSVEAQYQPVTHDAYAGTTSNAIQLQSLSSVTLASAASPSPFGTPLVLTATVPTIGGTPATGTVQFVEGSTVLGTGTLSTGTASYTNSTLARGPHTITAVYAGDAHYGTSTSSSISQVISNPTTTVSLSSSANPAQYNAAITFTAILGSGNATGNVTFMDGSSVLSISAISSGTASFQTSSLTTGTHSITAVYSGDPAFVAHTSAVLSQAVNPSTAETLAIVSTGTPVVYGTAITFTATLGIAGATGTVQFKDGSTVIGTAAVSGRYATLTTAVLAAGTHSITAVYTGDANYAAANASAITQVVTQASSTTSVGTSAASSANGASVTFTATVASTGATGTVTFKDGASTIGTGTLSSGTATFATASLAVGTHSITAVYGGDTNYTGSTSSAITETITLSAAATTALSSSPNPSAYGASVTFTATLGTPAATGAITFKDGATTIGTGSVSGGVATFSTSALTGGPHTITAVYGGDSTYASTTSTALTQTVNLSSAATSTVATSGTPATYGTSITFTATLATSAATGTVTFKDGGTTLGTGSVAGGSANFSTSALSGGTHSITAVYSGDANYATTTSPALTQTVTLSTAATTSLATSASPATYGSSVTFTATLGTTAATGAVAFKDNGTTIGTGTVSAGIASFATSALNTGSHPITAVYSGDINYATTSSSTLTQVINQATPTLAAPALSPASAAFGTSITITQTVPSGLTGLITFYANGVSLGSATISGTAATLPTTGLAGGVNSITGSFAGNTNYTAATSAAASITISPATPTIAAPTASPNPSVYGASVTLTQNMPAGATGNVTFYAGATSLGTGTISSGVATLMTASLPTGTLTLTTHYAGNANYAAGISASGSTVVNATPTATALSASPTSGSFGTSISLTATVTASGSPVTGGTVDFQVAGASIGTGTTNGSGIATYTTTTLNAGANGITAVSVATGNYNTSTSPAATVTISQATPSLSAPVLSPASSTYGIAVTITQAVPAGATGTINFYAGATLLGTGTISGGVASLTTTTIPAGTNAITGGYGGNTNYTAATSSAASITVAQATPTLTAPTASPTNATYGTSVTLSQPVPAGVTGTITFLSNGVSLGTATVSGGIATLTTTLLPTGTNALTTQYGGNANFTGATSAAGSIVIAAAPTVTVLSGSPTGGPFGTSIVLTAAVTANSAPVTAGTVDFQIGGASIGTAAVNGSGVASLTSTTLNVAANVVTAIFGATANYAGSSSVATITITQATPSLSAPTISPSGGSYGTGITLTQSFPPGATGTASFYSGGLLLGTANISGGIAVLTTTALPAGSNAVTTQWPGSGNYTAATSAPATVAITQATPVLGAPSASPASPAFGSPVTLSQPVPPGATGTVTFTSGGVTLGTGTIVNGIATITTSSLPSGSNAIVATYNGNNNYTSATATGSVTVSQATPALAAPTASPAGGSYGTSITLTQPVPSGLTGSITFMAGGTVLGTATISGGVATLVAPLLPAGSNSITGLYGGNVNYGASTSAAATVTISQITPTLAAPSTSPSSIAYGGSVTLTQTVPSGATGSVTFASGATILGTATISGGVATLVTTAIPGGSSPVTGLYSGNNNYTSALSAAAIVTVAPVVPVLAAPGASPSSGPYGTPITLTQVMPSGATGTVTFTVNGVTLGTATIVNGVATLTSTAIPAGTNLTVAAYPGNGNYTAGTSSPTTITITQATPVLPTTSVSPASAPFSSPVTITQAVPSGATGTVTFISGGVTLGTATIASGVASLTTSTLPLGSQTIAGTYNGNTNYAAATAVPGSVTIIQASPILAAPSAAPPSATYGASVILTQAVPSGLTGSITFLSGTSVLGTATISSGVATFATSALPTGGNAVTGVYGGSTNYTSATSPPTTVTVTPASTTLAAPSASPSSITYGGSVTLTQIVPPGATGTVTFTSGSLVLGTATIVNGVATLVTTAIPGGSSPVIGMYNGSNNFAPVASAPAIVVVAPAVPVLAAPGASPSGGPYGTSVTLTQTMPPGATGTVTFTANGVVLGTGTIVNGVATLTTTAIPAGTNIILGAFPGNGNYTTGTSAPTTITITQATPVLAAPLATPSPAPFGSSVTLTQSVPAAATGTVVFSSGSTVLGTGTISGGSAILTVTTLPTGTDPIIAAYSGNANWSAATSPVGYAIITAAAPTLTAPIASPANANYGTSVTLTQTVPPGATGTITFMSGSTILGTATIVNGVATLTTTALPGGTNTVTSVYSGGGNYAPTTSSPTTVTIAPVTPVLAAPTASTTNAAYGTSIILSQTVPPGVTGTITFRSGSTVLGTATIVNGVATLTTAAIPPGTNSITSVYGGNGNYTASTSPSISITIAASSTTVALTASPLGAPVNDPVTLTASVSSNGTPAGSTTSGIAVQFFDGTVSLGSTLLSPSGIATLTTTTLTVGSHVLTANFPGAGIYPASTSAPVTVAITQITASLPSPIASPASGVYGTSITLTQTLPLGASGTVIFMSGNVVLGTAPIINGVATLTTTAIPAGTNTITAIYSGNAIYAPTTSTAGTVVIQPATPAIPTLTASPTTAVFSTPVALTATLGAGLTGSVSFFSGSTAVGTAIIANGAATLTTSALAVGTDVITATFTGNNNYASISSPPVTVTITPPTYTITANPPSLTIHAGQTGTTVLTFTPVGGYSGTFTITCAGLPANAVCQFLQAGVSNPIVVMNGSNQPIQATLNLMTSVPSTTASVVRPARADSTGTPVYAFMLPIGLILLAGAMRTRKRLGRFGSLIALPLAAGAILTGLAGCGGGGFGVTATPVGNSVVQVTATASAVSTPGSGNGSGTPAPALSLSITIIQ